MNKRTNKQTNNNSLNTNNAGNNSNNNSSCCNNSCDNNSGNNKKESEMSINKFFSEDNLSLQKGIIKNFSSRNEKTPILLGLHGYGDSASGFMQFLSELEPGVPAVTLNAPYRLADIYPSSISNLEGFSWFSSMLYQGEILNKEADDACEYIIEWCNRNIGNKNSKYFLIPIGFSQGGFLVTELLRMVPERIVAAVNLSGLHVPAIFPNDQEGDRKLMALKTEESGIPTFYGYGTDDSIIDYEDVKVTEEWFKSVSNAYIHRYHGLDHAISTMEVRDIREFLRPFFSQDV